MKVIVLNGSPKGELSVTYHHVLYLKKHFENVNFEYIHVGKLIKKYEKNLEAFDEIMDKIRGAELVFWIYPVYTFLVPYQLMRFIELIIERKYVNIFAGKYSTQLSTSKHFYDVTAYNYIHQISEDFETKHIYGHMADMNDLLNEKGRMMLIDFFENVADAVNKEKYIVKKYKSSNPYFYPFSYNEENKKPKRASNIVIIYSGLEYSSNTRNMISCLEDNCSYLIHKVDLSHLNIQNGCLGDVRCLITGKCIYRDDFETIYSEKIASADIVLYASDIKNHWINPNFKKFSDRTFSNGHRIGTKNKGVGYLLSGSLREEHNLRDVLEARADVGNMYLLDIVTDEDIDTLDKIKSLCEKIDYYMAYRPERPVSFWGVGGMKILRDLVYSMRSIMKEDHKFYKKEKLYDFPKKRFLHNLVIGIQMKLMRNQRVLRKFSPKLSKHIISNYQDAIKKY